MLSCLFGVGIECQSSENAVNALNHGIVSSAPKYLLSCAYMLMHLHASVRVHVCHGEYVEVRGQL